MFWENEAEYFDVFKEYSAEKVGKLAEKYNININQDSLSNRWGLFGNVYAREHGFDDLTSSSIGYMVSSYMTGMGVCCGSDVYFDEDRIDDKILDLFNDLDGDDELENRKILVEGILKLYRENDFERKVENLGVRLTAREFEMFMRIDGKSKTEKFQNLLKNYWK